MRVLIALDGSELSELALKEVGPWLRRLGFEAIVATVLDPDKLQQTYETGVPYPFRTPATSSGTPLPTVDVPRRVYEDRAQALERARMDATEYLESCVARYLRGVNATTVVDWAGNPAEGILSLAEQHRANVIVLGTHGRSGLSRLVMGSVAEEILKRASVPVLPIRSGMTLVPPEDEGDSP